MFTLEFGADNDINLVFQNDQIRVVLNPMEPEDILNFKIDDDFDRSPCNGCFGIYWSDSEFISLCCSNYNDEAGGELSIRIAKTPDNLNSLKECLAQWYAHFSEASTHERSSSDSS